MANAQKLPGTGDRRRRQKNRRDARENSRKTKAQKRVRQAYNTDSSGNRTLRTDTSRGRRLSNREKRRLMNTEAKS